MSLAVSSQLPPLLYHWTSASRLVSILTHGLRPYEHVVYLQTASQLEAAAAYYNPPAHPVRLTIDIAGLPGSFLPDLAAWSDLLSAPEDDFDPWDSSHSGLIGTLDEPSPFDTLHYTGCICYRGPIPASAILESLSVPLPDSSPGL